MSKADWPQHPIQKAIRTVLAAAQLRFGNASFRKIARVIDSSDRIAILSHQRPDGDAIGSQIALGLVLSARRKRVSVWSEEDLVDRFRFLQGSEMIIRPPAEPQEFDLVIVLDTAEPKLFGADFQAVRRAKKRINIDHHLDNTRFGDLNYIAPASSTAEILYEFFRKVEGPGWATPAVASALHLGIITDTRELRQVATPRTKEIEVELIKLGTDVEEIAAQLSKYKRERISLLREIFSEECYHAAGRIHCLFVTQEAKRRANIDPGKIDDPASFAFDIEGVEVGLVFEELDGGIIKVSMRSHDNGVPVDALCRLLGGGGRPTSAACRINGELKAVHDDVIRLIETSLTTRPPQQVSDLIKQYPKGRIPLLHQMFETVCYDGGGQILSFSVTEEAKRRANIDPDELDDLARYTMVQGVVMGFVFEEMNGGRIKIRARSDQSDFPLASIWEELRMDGDRTRAVCEVVGELGPVRARVLSLAKRIMGGEHKGEGCFQGKETECRKNGEPFSHSAPAKKSLEISLTQLRRTRHVESADRHLEWRRKQEKRAGRKRR